ncbi:(2Fe-2S)-binding protein [Aureimonas fodinaquatilis]|uniref:(2Fe-2S)-binding protein n=1 Tax=Aureimonas fodinaquatilis TaxID=2565783 RepID=A0A5B0E0N6_9HYPH|nr:(2Fe-2S)-binding protein [Aureimonas fodinaquatilis]KAA0972188.1 (2Fe-2S)-binding protein [Aureimonas fodinaquatilis]
MKMPVELTVNGERIADLVEPRTSLADFLRDRLRLTGTHTGCEMGVCGACMVLLNEQPVNSCLVLAVQAANEEIQTIEGLAEQGLLRDLQTSFHERNALQCGYCTSGMLISAHALLLREAVPDRESIRAALSGNYCRCTGYEAIVDAIAATATQRQQAARGAA